MTMRLPDRLRLPPKWARNAVVYEVNVRQYTPEGTFAALRPLLPRVRALGIWTDLAI